jgi:DNA (cytosine-5)-methyltransferase 1
MARTLTVIDLFCGAGGLSLGLREAGFSPTHAVDCWAPAVETYRKNLGDHVSSESIDDSTAFPDADVIAGGPPCQGFSSAGRRVADDDRNSLVRVFANLIARHRPRAFIFENVEGFLTTGGGQFVLDLLEPLIDAGYQVHLRKINAANFGVPQHRKRVVAIGGLGWNPGFPEPTHRAFGAPGAHLTASRRPATPTLGQAIASLPAPAADPPGEPIDHYARPLKGEDLERARLLQQGQSMRDLPEHLWHDSYRRRAFRRVMDGTPCDKRGGAPAGVRRLVAAEPSKAITGGSLRDFLHPAEHRALTIREAARIQTYPDTFCFIGGQADRIQLIGNSVPPVLAKAIGAHLLGGLRTSNEARRPEGKLLSFIPTLSEGKSPILQQVCDLVDRRFGVGGALVAENGTLWH